MSSGATPPFDETATRELLRDVQPVLSPASARGALVTTAAALAVFLAALVLYIATLAPTVGYGDAAQLQTAAHELELTSGAGGRPLSVALAHLATRLHFGDAAYRVNLASAFAAALAVLMVFLVALLLLDATDLGGSPRGRLLFAAAGAASLAVAQPFWARAVVADPTPLNVFLIATVTALWIARLSGGGGWTILAGAVFLGILLANLRAIALVTPVYLLAGIWLLTGSGRRSLGDAARIVALAYVVGLLPLVLLTVRDLLGVLGAPSPPYAQSVTGALAGAASRTMGGPFSLAPAAEALARFGLRLVGAFLAGILFAGVGLLVLLLGRGARRAGALLLALLAASAAGSLLTGSTTTVAWVLVAVLVAVGAAAIVRRGSVWAAAFLAVFLVGIPVAFHSLLPRLAARPQWRPWITAAFSPPAAGSTTLLHPWRAGDRQARSEAESLLTALPAGALLVTGRDLAGPLRYLEEVEDRPSEVTVLSAPADLDTLLDQHLRKRVIAFAGLDSAGLDSVRRRVRLVPQGAFFLAEPRPAALDLADERFREGRWWEAAYHYGAVLGSGGATDQEYSEALARWSVALERSGFPELAEAVTTRYVVVTGNLIAAHEKLGDLYFAAGALERAATHFAAARAAVPAVPKDEAAKAYLEGRIAEARGDPNAARSAYQRCLELDPNHRQAKERLAQLGGGGEGMRSPLSGGDSGRQSN